MNYYAHNIGDFAAETRFLSLEEIGVYVVLKDMYLATGMPLAYDRIATALPSDATASIDKILKRFYVEEDGVYRCDAFDKMLAEFAGKGEKNRENAKKRWESHKTASRSDATGCDSDATRTKSDAKRCLTNNQEPITNTPPSGESTRARTRESAATRKQFVPEEVGLFITEQEWQDFLKLRRAKHAPLTETAWARLKREAELAGLSLSDALGMCVSKGWTSIDHNWESLKQQKKLTPEEVGRLWAEAGERMAQREREEQEAAYV